MRRRTYNNKGEFFSKEQLWLGNGREEGDQRSLLVVVADRIDIGKDRDVSWKRKTRGGGGGRRKMDGDLYFGQLGSWGTALTSKDASEIGVNLEG
jgi:hypothetical protein